MTQARVWFGPRLAPVRRWSERVGLSASMLELWVRRQPAPAMSLVCIYRQRNAAYVRGMLDGLPAGTPVALLGLDGIAPSLAAETIAEGPGLRVDLLNRL